jgi:hypothetical protein
MAAGPPNERARRNNHVVTAGYLGRGFGVGRQQPRSRSVDLFDIRNRSVRRVPATDAFRKRDFSVVRGSEGPRDDLEREWSRVEARALNDLRTLNPRGGVAREEGAAAVALMAIHLARSFRLQRVAEESWSKFGDPLPEKAETRAELRRAFELTFGRESRAGEIASLTRAYVEAERDTNAFFVGQQATHYNLILDYLMSLPFRFSVAATPMRHFLLTSDSPALLVSRDHTTAAALANGLRLGEEAVVIMPMTKRVLAQVGTSAFDFDLSASDVGLLNRLQAEEALRFVAGHPRTDLTAVAPDLADFERLQGVR